MPISEQEFQACVVVPTYRNGATIVQAVKEAHAATGLPVIVVDDGSGPDLRRVYETQLPETTDVVFREKNGGKGAAVKTGFAHADTLGFSHVAQIDADLQHRASDLASLVKIARSHPQSLVLGSPNFDSSAPRSRRLARKLTAFWINRATAGKIIDDSMCGIRVYPVKRALAAGARGNRMDFDPEIAVRMVWQGTNIINVPVTVRYHGSDGVSHFQLVRDNLRLARLYTKLMFERFQNGIGRPALSASNSEDSLEGHQE